LSDIAARRVRTARDDEEIMQGHDGGVRPISRQQWPSRQRVRWLSSQQMAPYARRASNAGIERASSGCSGSGAKGTETLADVGSAYCLVES
jgi:hypothetical protein